jgi:hypothetical protein
MLDNNSNNGHSNKGVEDEEDDFSVFSFNFLNEDHNNNSITATAKALAHNRPN